MTTRRVFLGEITRLAALAAVVPNDWRVMRRLRLAEDPFGIGIASGDPTSNGVTLWTRLAPRPLDPDGGMTGQRAAVAWELADDDKFSRIVKKGTATATPELGYSVHVDVDGLASDRWYFYRFVADGVTSPVGRTRTTPADGSNTPLRFNFASCQHYEQGLFTAYEHMAKDDVDLVAHLGDYVYEYAGAQGRVRMHAGGKTGSLASYRQRYAQYKSDEHLRAAHLIAPWIVIWDDHEVENNYAGDASEVAGQTPEMMHAHRAAAYQGWWENQPVRIAPAKQWADLSITRTINWGGLARFWMLDTRQFRSDQACGDGTKVVPCDNWDDPARTLMGDAQEKWLVDGIGKSKSRWQVIGNQVMMAPYDAQMGEGARVSLDQWSGYPVARDRLLGALAERAPNRTVVITGDIHSNWVNELRSSFSKPGAPTIGAEFVGTSITSGGDGSGTAANLDARRAENPHLQWQNSRRGYVRCDVTPNEWRAAYKTIAFVTKPDAPIETASQWLVENGKPGIQKV